MRPVSISAILALLATLALAAPIAAQATDAPAPKPAGEYVVRVHVISKDGKPAPEGIPVELTVMLKEMAGEPLEATTDATGVAEFRVSLPRQFARCLAVIHFGDLTFVSAVAGLGPDNASEAIDLTIRVLPPPTRLPAWSYFALASIWVLAFGLVTFRRSDRRLPD